MRNHSYRLLALLLLTVATEMGFVSAQGIEMVNHDTIFIRNCYNLNESFYSYQHITEPFDSWGVIESNGTPVSMNIMHTGYGISSHLTVSEDTQVVLDTIFSGTTYTNIQLECSAQVITIHFTSEESFSLSGHYFYFTISCSIDSNASPCSRNIRNITVNNITDNSAVVQWQGNSQSTIVEYGDNINYVSTNFCRLTNLEPNTEYTVYLLPNTDFDYPCCAQSVTFSTEPEAYIGCPDVTDLRSSYIKCHYGTFGNPYLHQGLEDHGSFSGASRHTVHTDPSERDYRTGNILPTVCPGTNASVRLGNWSTGAQAEAISYKLHIDTLFYSLLLLHYAAVLENPNHDLSAQPRFRLEILNQNGNAIDPVCGVADFTANASLGWNDYLGTLWKDWTTVGFDLSPYHGQDVYLRFTTYDCAAGGHYGYAYFSTECMHKSVFSEQCGIFDSNTITAPAGFNYIWYDNFVEDPISTSQTFSYPNENIYYHCRLISTENPSCYVTLSTYGGNRWPQASFSVVDTANRGCDGYRVTFLNQSHVVGDFGAQLSYHESCETAFWDFGDGETSTVYSPQHTYYDSGTYTVTLISGIANGQCLDTTSMLITVPDLYSEYFITQSYCDSVLFLDTLLITRDTSFQIRHNYPHSCDSVFYYDLFVNKSRLTVLPIDTFCYSNTYTWKDTTVGFGDTLTKERHYLLEKHYTTTANCDSTVQIHLVQLPLDSLSITHVADCKEKMYRLEAHSIFPYLTWQSTPPDTNINGHETERILYVSPHETTCYEVISSETPSFQCPSFQRVTLLPVTFPEAELEVNPDMLTPEQQLVTAYDLSREYDHRRWSVVLHGTQHDTVQLSETSRYMSYHASLDPDSLTVLLAVNNSICYDTARRTLPVVVTTLYAPNVFTPDAADINSRFIIIGADILQAELTIYNRQGIFVYTTDDIEQGWDGTSNGSPCPQGAYVWHLRYRNASKPNQWHSAIGTVTLLR